MRGHGVWYGMFVCLVNDSMFCVFIPSSGSTLVSCFLGIFAFLLLAALVSHTSLPMYLFLCPCFVYSRVPSFFFSFLSLCSLTFFVSPFFIDIPAFRYWQYTVVSRSVGWRQIELCLVSPSTTSFLVRHARSVPLPTAPGRLVSHRTTSLGRDIWR